MGRHATHDHPLLRNHTRAQVAAICNVSYSTVKRWVWGNQAPQWAFEKLGYSHLTPSEVSQVNKLEIEKILRGFREVFKEDEWPH